MNNEGPAPSAEMWPDAALSFRVTWGADSDALLFQEVSGLDGALAFRPAHSAMPRAARTDGHARITMKRGIFKPDNALWRHFNDVRTNTVKRIPLTIVLLDETRNSIMTWTLANAWPTKITAANLNPDGGEVIVESIEIAHEGVTVGR